VPPDGLGDLLLDAGAPDWATSPRAQARAGRAPACARHVAARDAAGGRHAAAATHGEEAGPSLAPDGRPPAQAREGWLAAPCSLPPKKTTRSLHRGRPDARASFITASAAHSSAHSRLRPAQFWCFPRELEGLGRQAHRDGPAPRNVGHASIARPPVRGPGHPRPGPRPRCAARRTSSTPGSGAPQRGGLSDLLGRST
jgi:hypothetical protein